MEAYGTVGSANNPYKGGAPAINDLLGGQIPMSFNNGPEASGQLEAGTLRALAVTTASRTQFLPNVPAISETVPGYDTEVWWGLLGPAGMSAQLVAKLSQDFVAALNTEPVKERLLSGSDRRINSEGVVIIKAQTHRSLEKNRDDALARLRALIAAAEHVPRTRRPTRATRGAHERRLQGKDRRARLKALRRRIED